jgi:acyl-CoA-binding protein
MGSRAACARRPAAFAGPPVAATAVPAFDVLALFDRGRALKLVEAHFDEVVQRVEDATGIPAGVQTQLYGLFKQAVAGNASGGGPGLFGNKQKWSAWEGNAGLSKREAMQKYIKLALQYVDNLGEGK